MKKQAEQLPDNSDNKGDPDKEPNKDEEDSDEKIGLLASGDDIKAFNLEAMTPVKQEVKKKVAKVHWKEEREFPKEAETELADNISKSKKKK